MIKNLNYYKPVLITLGLSVNLILLFYMNDDERISKKEGLTSVDGSTITVETPIEDGGHIDQMIDDSQTIQTYAQGILDIPGIETALAEEYRTELSGIVDEQETTQANLTTLKADYETAIVGLEDEVEAVRDLRDATLVDVNNEYNTLVDERQNKTRLVKNNKYYEKRYAALSGIMLRITIIISIFTLLIWANNKGYLGESIPAILFPVLIAFALFYILYLYVDVQARNSSDYDKIDFNFNPDSPDNPVGDNTDSFATIKEASKEFNRVKTFNKELEKESGKYSVIQPFMRT